MYPCSHCGKRIDSEELITNHGWCDECLGASLEDWLYQQHMYFQLKGEYGELT